MTSCPFCSIAATQLICASELSFAIWDAFPVSPGHALVVPKRHVEAWEDLSLEERAALTELVDPVMAAVQSRHPADGFNLGMNLGSAAGQTVPHLHLHVIPRRDGDVSDPRGGVRHVIPHLGNYLRANAENSVRFGQPPHSHSLISGERDPLLPHLLAHLDLAKRVDIAVAFVLRSGMEALEERLRELLERGGHLRFLTGDYLGVTDPDALTRLLDLMTLAPSPGQVEARIFESQGHSFHPKAYIFDLAERGEGLAFVGSSNLSNGALGSAVEWNYRVVSSRDAAGLQRIRTEFERLFSHPKTRPLSREWIEQYRSGRPEMALPPSAEITEVAEPPESYEPEIPTPHEIQEEALAALEATRASGNEAGLVVLATGLGKTWLSAFDSVGRGFQRVLFVAHREEILNQAYETYRRIAPRAKLGFFRGDRKDPDADVLFASIQTLARRPNLNGFDPRDFDYIVVDEFHHACAKTYARVIDYFQPQFLLGLTATPERADGGDLLTLCGNNLVFRCDLVDGIRRGLLSPFAYFGVPDHIEYENIPWRSNRFDEEKLTEAVATQERAANALEQWRTRAGERTLGFCVSIRHAEFMKDYFLAQGVRAAAVHSGPGSAPRAAALEKLEGGELQIVFAVDVFNEGVDVPAIDTVLMLRPTESRVLWLQQFGRGLRIAEGKDRLTVVDYIGNHRAFLLKPQALLGLRETDRELSLALERLDRGELDLPPGCEVTYELEAREILRDLLEPSSRETALEDFCRGFIEKHGRRPTAAEALQEGLDPRSARKGAGSWFGLLAARGFLSAEETRVHQAKPSFLEDLETTPMTKSYKMVVLLALLAEGRLPGEVGLEDLVQRVRRLVKRSALLRTDFSVEPDDLSGLQRLLVREPIKAWTGTAAGREVYFKFDGQTLATTFDVPAEERQTFQDLARELVDWRLAQYLHSKKVAAAGTFECRLVRSGSSYELQLPPRQEVPGLPYGWVTVTNGDQAWEVDFGERRISRIAEAPGVPGDELPRLLGEWFSGSLNGGERVRFVPQETGYSMTPATGLRLWAPYSRKEVGEAFGLDATKPTWRTGFVVTEKNVFLFVTLDKSALSSDAQYDDGFLSSSRFRWQSQNQTKQNSKHGRLIRDPEGAGVRVHLFVRRHAKFQGRAAPFFYLGEVDFIDWHGERPITVTWELQQPVKPEVLERLRGEAPPGAQRV